MIPPETAHPFVRRAVCLGILLIAFAVGTDSARAEGSSSKPPRASAPKLAAARFHHKPNPLPGSAKTVTHASFLGPSRNGIYAETKLLKKWGPSGPKLVWEMETGNGYSSPAIAGDRLIYFHRIGDADVVDCLDPETGNRIWSFWYPTTYADRYQFGNGPRSTPVIHQGRVFTHGADGMLHCLDLKTGDVVWKRQTSKEFAVPQDFFGLVSTPLIEGHLLIVNVGAPGGPCVVAFDTRNGTTVWKAGDQWGPSSASPMSATINGARRLFVFAGGDSDPPTGGLLSIDPVNGTIVGRFPFRSKTYTSVNAATPVVVGSDVFVTSGYHTGGAMVRWSSNGQPSVVWHNRHLGAHFATPIYKNGFLYGFDGANRAQTALVCLEWSTGKELWREQPEWQKTITQQGKSSQRPFYLLPGAMIHADGDFLTLTETGDLLWLDLSRKGYRQISRTELFIAKETWTPPVLSRGMLYVTQNQRDTIHNTPPRLLCYDLRSTN